MARGYQSITIVGNLGRDPEKRTTQGGKGVTNFSVAVTTGSGDYEHTEWFNCQAWDQLGDIVEQYAHKGSRVQCVGTLKTRTYEDKDGTERKATDLTVRDFLLLDSRQSEDADTRPSAPQKPVQRAPQARPQTRNQPQPIDDDDSIPF